MGAPSNQPQGTSGNKRLHVYSCESAHQRSVRLPSALAPSSASNIYLKYTLRFTILPAACLEYDLRLLLFPFGCLDCNLLVPSSDC